jgi:hypothetical protein
MTGELRIATNDVHDAEERFVVRVEIINGHANDRVRIRLWQTAGRRPFYAGTASADLDANGFGLAVFDDVILHGGDSVAVLVADDDESAVPLRRAEKHIEVLP